MRSSIKWYLFLFSMHRSVSVGKSRRRHGFNHCFRQLIIVVSCISFNYFIQFRCSSIVDSFYGGKFWNISNREKGLFRVISFSICIMNKLLLLSLLSFTLLEFFTSVLSDGFSLEFEGQQVSSSLQVSSQYSGHCQ